MNKKFILPQLFPKFSRKIKELRLFHRYTEADRRHMLSGPLHIWKMERDFQIWYLKHIGLTPEQELLDVGCGTLRGGIPIIDYLEPGHYFGIETRSIALLEALKELEENDLTIKHPTLMLMSDLNSTKLGKTFDVIWAFDVFYILSDQILNNCLSFAFSHLKDTGTLYANVIIGERDDKHWQGFPMITRDLNFYNYAAKRNNLVLTDMGKLGSFGFHSGQDKHDEKTMLKFIKNKYPSS